MIYGLQIRAKKWGWGAGVIRSYKHFNNSLYEILILHQQCYNSVYETLILHHNSILKTTDLLVTSLT